MRFTLLLAAALALVAGCDLPPAFAVPSGPPRSVALDVELPIHVLGRWTVDGFSDTLRMELAKYNIEVGPRRSEGDVVALIDLGRVTYRDWQEIDVALARGDAMSPWDRVHVPDLSMTTLDVAAQSVAALIARRVWSLPAAVPAQP
jgi:hypothetical protein